MEKNNWINVKDKLPEFDKEVLTYRKSVGKNESWEIIDIGYLSYKTIGSNNYEYLEWVVSESTKVDTITHWMYLPKPPENQ